MIRTILVDDSDVFLESVEYFMSTFPYIKVVDKAASSKDAIEKIEKYKPDLVLVDIDMPVMNGIEVTRHIKKKPDSPFVIIVSYHNGDEYETLAKDAGADGFVTKADFALNAMQIIESMLLLKEKVKQ